MSDKIKLNKSFTYWDKSEYPNKTWDGRPLNTTSLTALAVVEENCLTSNLNWRLGSKFYKKNNFSSYIFVFDSKNRFYCNISQNFFLIRLAN